MQLRYLVVAEWRMYEQNDQYFLDNIFIYILAKEKFYILTWISLIIAVTS